MAVSDFYNRKIFPHIPQNELSRHTEMVIFMSKKHMKLILTFYYHAHDILDQKRNLMLYTP